MLTLQEDKALMVSSELTSEYDFRHNLDMARPAESATGRMTERRCNAPESDQKTMRDWGPLERMRSNAD
jgi:hypothetical protein